MADQRKPLFTTDGREEWTEEARALDQALTQAINPIIRTWVAAGYSKRDLQLIVHACAMDIGASIACGFFED